MDVILPSVPDKLCCVFHMYLYYMYIRSVKWLLCTVLTLPAGTHLDSHANLFFTPESKQLLPLTLAEKYLWGRKTSWIKIFIHQKKQHTLHFAPASAFIMWDMWVTETTGVSMLLAKYRSPLQPDPEHWMLFRLSAVSQMWALNMSAEKTDFFVHNTSWSILNLTYLGIRNQDLLTQIAIFICQWSLKRYLLPIAYFV